MSGGSGPVEWSKRGAIRLKALQWRITHGEPELADEWLFRIVCDLVADRPLSRDDRETLIGVLLPPALDGKGASLFNKMALPDKRRNVTGKMRMFFTAEAHREAGMPVPDAVELAAEKNGLTWDGQPQDEEDEVLKREGNAYKEARKQYKKLLREIEQELEEHTPPPQHEG